MRVGVDASNQLMPNKCSLSARSLHPKSTEFIWCEKKPRTSFECSGISERYFVTMVPPWHRDNNPLSQATECIITFTGLDEPPECRLFWGHLSSSVAFTHAHGPFDFPTRHAPLPMWPSSLTLPRFQNFEAETESSSDASQSQALCYSGRKRNRTVEFYKAVKMSKTTHRFIIL